MNKFINSPKRGQTMVEFALILPIFIFLVVVIFDFGRAVYYYNAIHNAAREGARYGVIHPKDTDYSAIAARAKEYAIGLGLDNISVNVYPGPNELVGTVNNPTIKVTVTYCFEPVTPFVEMIVHQTSCACNCNHLYLSSDAVMRTEALP
jgi:Flp pilus assembly protein TadG